MVIGTDENTGLEPQRRWRVVPILSIVIPAVIFLGATAWFIRAYVVPPMVTIADLPPLLAPEQARATEPPRTPDWPPVRAPETTASASQPSTSQPSSPWPSPPASPASVFPPAPAAVRPAAAPTTASWPVSPREPRIEIGDAAVRAGEPIAGPIPLPQPRPRLSLAIVRGPVPLPRPRPDR
jgi:hypothetical protein